MCMQKIGLHSIEDCLEVLVGLQKHNLKFQIENKDEVIISSIARQVFRGTALTDRQYTLIKEKLINYKTQFESQDVIGFDRALEKLRKPLREIDRSKFIKIVDYPDEDIVYQNDNSNKFIKIRFPFKKSDIALLDEIKSKNYYHKRGSHAHFYALEESTIVQLLDRFLNKNFEIDSDLVEIYKKCKDIQENRLNYLSGIVDKKLINVHKHLAPIVENELGSLDNNNYLKFIDRRFRYGFQLFDTKEPNSLVEKIAYRTDKDFMAKPSEYSTNSVLEALWNLDRFPMLVVLEKQQAEDQLYEFVTFYRDILSIEEQSVLFRQDGDTGFNQMVKDRSLNNWVDNSTKIVYISSDKLPKVLLSSEWKPTVTFSYNSSTNRMLDLYINTYSDLVVYREEDLSPMRKFSRYYG